MQLTLTINESPALSADELTAFVQAAERKCISPEQLLRQAILNAIQATRSRKRRVRTSK